MSWTSFVIMCCCTGSQSVTDAEFIKACFRGDYREVVEFARERDLNAQVRLFGYENRPLGNGDTWTPLTAAIVGKRWQVASFLIGAGADVNQATSNGYHPIWLLAAYGAFDSNALAVAHLILESGGKVDEFPIVPTTCFSFRFQTALDVAVSRRDVEIVRLLLSHGANPDLVIAGQRSVREEFAIRFERLESTRNKELVRALTPDYDEEWSTVNKIKLLLQGPK